jgi:plasmid stabilization system protein ParE
VARTEIAPRVTDDFERILEHLATDQVENSPQRINEIIAALDVLELNPLIGQLSSHGTRELAIRSQREAAYAEFWEA